MDLKRIQQIAPHFMDDRDEDWMKHLPLDKKTYIVDRRAEILNEIEKLDNHAHAYRSQLTLLRDAPPERKAEAKKEFELKQKSFEESRDEKARALLPTLRRLRDIGIETKRKIEQDEINATSNKRQRVQDVLDPSAVDTDPNIELVTDDYLPRYLPQPTSSLNRRKPKSTKNTTQGISNLQLKTSPVRKRDAFFDGVDEAPVRGVLSDLRTEIIKHNCRDRVIKAVQSIILRDQRLASMESVVDITKKILCSEL